MSLICLQGGGEFAPECAPMDAALLGRAGGGPVVLLPAAAAPGREYAVAGANGARYFTGLGAAGVLVAPDPREDAAAAVAAVRRAALLFLPGGSPRRLREALLTEPLASAVRELAATDAVLAGASAGAMVLCGWTVLPEGGAPEVAAGLGVVPDFAVLPHYRPGGGRDGWVTALRERDAAIDVLGIPECSGVLIEGERVVATGVRAATLLMPDGEAELSLGE